MPGGDGWIHELKHDGFRIVALKDGDNVRLWSRNGRNWRGEFVAITGRCDGPAGREDRPRRRGGRALRGGPAGLSCAPGPRGCATACLYAFDLLLVGAQDLRGLALVDRRALLREHLKSAGAAIIYSDHMTGADGEGMFRHACRMGLEGIVSKRPTAVISPGGADRG